MPALLEQNLEAIRALCREFGVLRLDIFGSATTDRFDPERSDLDFLVEYPLAMILSPGWRGISSFRSD